MTIVEVLKQNIAMLERVSIPVTDEKLWNIIRSVLHNEKACIEVIEQAQDEAEKKPEETEANDGE